MKRQKKGFEYIRGPERVTELVQCIIHDKKAVGRGFIAEIGACFVEDIFSMERESLAGPDYAPIDPALQKWASQPGSVFLGAHKVKVQIPRLRHRMQGEVQLQSYAAMKQRGRFSEEFLAQIMRRLCAGTYKKAVTAIARKFGVSALKHCIEISAEKLRGLRERDLSAFKLFAIFIETIHQDNQAFTVALAVTKGGEICLLGFLKGSGTQVC